MEFVGQAFEGEVRLDGNSYRDCSFEKVHFIYGGGALSMDNCRLNEFTWQFTGDLANGLHALYQMFGKDGLLQIINGFIDPRAGVVTELQLPSKGTRVSELG
ncbi:hypothetical protein E2493_11270 [Sphingomonas parva]|uniref:Uncharacterized protein n=1 Tax=Sphingomonas parva TaxID=2555898 RepID=A0A4Y8ZUM3_9SPHN|nr:hypothetical protein [Sphingomonas parva]TFI58156.1 hypothetical protein E2493_11270 [Sphingomonas parva]